MFCRFQDMKQMISAQTGPKLHNYLCACPFLGHSYFEFKWFAQIRTCHILRIFVTCAHVQFADMQYAHKIVKNISSPNLAKMLSFVIILLSSRDPRCMWANGPTSFSMRQMMATKHLVGFAKFVIILLSLLLITHFTTTRHVGAFF